MRPEIGGTGSEVKDRDSVRDAEPFATRGSTVADDDEEPRIGEINEEYTKSQLYKEMSFCQKICILVKNCPYMMLVLGLSTLFFEMQGITYWFPTYFTKTMEIPEQ